MNDLPSSIALQQSNAKSRTGEELETFGKEAATRFVRGEGSLTETVVETIKSAGLSPEQVRRVVEFANIDAFHQEFRKEGAGHRVVEFEGGPADFAEVLRDLNDGGTPAVMDKHAYDYSTPPPDTALLESRWQDSQGHENQKLAAAFGVDEEEALPFADPLRESLDLRDKLAGAEQELSAELGSLEQQMFETVEGMHFEVKQAALEGTTLGQIVAAWGTVSSKPGFMKAAFMHLTPRLIEQGVFPTKGAVADSIMKTASAGPVNPAHPLIIHFKDFCETLTKAAEVHAAHQEVLESLGAIGTFLKSAAAEGAWKNVTEGARKIAPSVGKFVRGSGQVAGDVAEAVTPYAPHAAALYFGNKAYQSVMSHVPGTSQYQIRQMRNGF